MPTTKEVDENRSPSKVLFAYGVDAVEVVRCKDCRFYDTHDHRCVRMNHGFKDDFFCSWGERKEDARHNNS